MFLIEETKAIHNKTSDSQKHNAISVYYFVLSVIFAVPTKFVTKPKKSVTAYKSWDTILKCDIFGFPSPVIKWTRPLKQLPVNRHVIDGNKLTIKNTTEDDDGAYVCQGANELGSVMGVIWIIVKAVGKPRIKNDLFEEEIASTMMDVFLFL